jgi:sterol desaturase/sphingolipid hydroxylase (fatty acid hydroxylase superfamily)
VDVVSPVEKFLIMTIAPTVVVASILEGWVLSRTQGYDWRALGISLFDMVGRIIFNFAVPLALSNPLINWAYEHRWMTLQLDSWQAFVLLFFGQEFCYYWYHRAAHRVRWFWCNHAVHHSPNELNLGTAYRIGMFGKLTGLYFFFTPLVWLGFDPKLILITVTINLLYQFWIHVTWIPKLGWLEWVLNTPSAHRVHHGANPEYLDCNYGGVLIIFDRLFGTYVAERDDLPPRYGLVKPLRSYNPLRVEFNEWLGLLKDLRRSRSIQDVLGCLFMPPGWHPKALNQERQERQQHQRVEGV